MAFQIIRSKQPPANDCVLLCDTSGSMDRRDTASGRRRIDHLAEILTDVLSRVRVRALFTFDSWVREVPLAQSMDLPEPSGGTALDLGLDTVADMQPLPEQVILITDGTPNSEEAAIASVQRLRRVVLTCYYVGPDHDAYALNFLERLASYGAAGSSAAARSIVQTKQLAQAIVLRITHDG